MIVGNSNFQWDNGRSNKMMYLSLIYGSPPAAPFPSLQPPPQSLPPPSPPCLPLPAAHGSLPSLPPPPLPCAPRQPRVGGFIRRNYDLWCLSASRAAGELFLNKLLQHRKYVNAHATYIVLHWLYEPIVVYRMELDKNRWFCSWNRDQNCTQNSACAKFCCLSQTRSCVVIYSQRLC